MFFENLLCYSPLEQYDIYPIQSQTLSINNVVFYLIIVTFIIVVLNSLGRTEIISNWWGILNETFYRTILSLQTNNVGKKYHVYFPLIYTIFHIILFSNLIGMIPYTSTPTVELIITQLCSFTLLFGILIIGFLTHRQYLLAVFIPAGTPLALVPLMIVLEIFAYITRTLSLGLRLGVNLITGHILVKVCVGFIWSAYLKGTSILILSLPLLLLTLFICLEILIAYLQSFIFTFITCLTLKDMT